MRLSFEVLLKAILIIIIITVKSLAGPTYMVLLLNKGLPLTASSLRLAPTITGVRESVCASMRFFKFYLCVCVCVCV